MEYRNRNTAVKAKRAHRDEKQGTANAKQKEANAMQIKK